MVRFGDRAFLLRCGDAILENVERDIGFTLVYNQRGREPDAVFAAAENQKAALEGEIHDAITQLRRSLACRLIFDDLDADHQTAAANIADDGVLFYPALQTRAH